MLSEVLVLRLVEALVINWTVALVMKLANELKYNLGVNLYL